MKKLVTLLLCICLLMAGFVIQGSAEESATASAEESATGSVTARGTNGWDEENATKIELNGDTAIIDGEGAAANGSLVTISAGGSYDISGSLADGQIRVDSEDKSAVYIRLSGAEISGGSSAAIYCKKADELVLILADGSENTLADASEYVYASAEDDEPDAALFSDEDLTITGNGSLTVQGNYKHGIVSKDDLVIEGGTIAVEAKNHGLRGKDSVTILGGDITIVAGKDGIQSDNTKDAEKGWISIEGGRLAIAAGNDGIQAETTLAISGGTFEITTGGGSANAPARQSSDRGQMGGFGARPNEGGTRPEGGPGKRRSATGESGDTVAEPTASTTTESEAEAEDSASSTSYKGLKAGTQINISGGTYALDCADDGVHSNGNIAVSGGKLTISSGDDGIHADDTLTINKNPTITIKQSYEGLEAQTINIEGGEIDITASDDGINAAGGEGGGSRPGMGGDYHLNISGGVISISAGADGLDSNGDIDMSGGEVYVEAAESGPEAAIDYDGSFTMTGGVLVGSGMSQMAQAPGSQSAQASLQVYYSSQQSAGTEITLTDASGKELLSVTPDKSFSNLVISLPTLQQGETYTLQTGSQSVSIVLSGVTTVVSDTGEAVSGNQGMGGNRRGMSFEEMPEMGGDMMPPGWETEEDGTIIDEAFTLYFGNADGAQAS